MMSRDIKITILGDGGVGKTALTNKFATGIYTDDYLPSNNLEYTGKEIKLSKNPDTIQLKVSTIAGQEEYDRGRPYSYDPDRTHVVMICFLVADSVTNALGHDGGCRTAFQSVLSKWRYETEFYFPDSAVVLVGIKADRRTPTTPIDHLIPGDWIEQCGRDTRNFAGYKEVSARDFTQEKMAEFFREVAEIGYANRRKRMLKKAVSSSCSNL